MTISEIKTDLIKNCPSLDGLLENLSAEQIFEIDATDVNWCKDWQNPSYGYFDSEEEAVSRALFSTYENLS